MLLLSLDSPFWFFFLWQQSHSLTWNSNRYSLGHWASRAPSVSTFPVLEWQVCGMRFFFTWFLELQLGSSYLQNKQLLNFITLIQEYLDSKFCPHFYNYHLSTYKYLHRNVKCTYSNKLIYIYIRAYTHMHSCFPFTHMLTCIQGYIYIL